MASLNQEETVKTRKADSAINSANKAICHAIGHLRFDSRGEVSVEILSQLRNFVEGIILKCYCVLKGLDLEVNFQNIELAIHYLKGISKYRILIRFHDYLQMSASHYTFDEEPSERLMLKYFEYLCKTRAFVKASFGINVLENLDEFPLDEDHALKDYYNQIAVRIDNHKGRGESSDERFYIQKQKPFYSHGKIYYEVTLTPAFDNLNKFDRTVAFTSFELNDNYAVSARIEKDNIQTLGKTMPIFIIVHWSVSIRECEFNHFIHIITGTEGKISSGEMNGYSRWLTTTGFNLVDLITMQENDFQSALREISQNAQATRFSSSLKKARTIIKKEEHGANVLRYLLYCMNNRILKRQLVHYPNPNLSSLYLDNKSIPFDNMPFVYSLHGHNPKIVDLLSCIPWQNRRYEFLARKVRNNTENKGELFTSLKEVSNFNDVKSLADDYNNRLWHGHQNNDKLVIANNQIFINGYLQDTVFIINKLRSLSNEGLKNFAQVMREWVRNPNNGVDSEEKRYALIKMFADSKVALVYGSAGTGKSTLINHISQFFSSPTKLYLAQTNPAVENLKRRVHSQNCEFQTITSFLSKSFSKTEFDILIIDECSTVSNSDMVKVLNKASFKLLLLVGDPYQIASIRFGNWFSIAQAFVPKTSVIELTKPYRTSDEGLLTLWKRVRNIDDIKENGDAILETSIHENYSSSLDESIFQRNDGNEIILCLNYDGLYGINNINRFLQEANPSPAINWGVQVFKVNDPILFNENPRFGTAIYNNSKGIIVGVRKYNEGTNQEQIEFDVELDRAIDGSALWNADFELLENSERGNSVIRFRVSKLKNYDSDDNDLLSVIPFQIAYAVSIHKSQGLEYDSVKLVITEEVDEMITHNIFYTAITRARKKLKIYWSPEVEHKILTAIHPYDFGKDISLLKKLPQPI